MKTFNAESPQSVFDANHLMLAGSLACHWTHAAQLEWMESQPSLPYRLHVGCDSPETGIFCLQILDLRDGKARASFSLGATPGEPGNGCYVSPLFPRVRLSSVETLAREARKQIHG